MTADTISDVIAAAIRGAPAHRPGRVPLVGVAGAQGSGKSWQCRAFAQAHPRVAHFSLDDVYHTKATRAERAARVHPLLVTRGPPGSHDLVLAMTVFAELAEAAGRTPLPRFDKLTDDRAPRSQWPHFAGRPDAILFDGWCLGALPATDDPIPLNPLEAEEDANGVWRAAVAEALEAYQLFFAAFDAFIYLRAPSWEIVRVWRGQQEEETLGRPLTAEENAGLDRFVMHYERVTRAMLTGHHRARWIVHLDDERNVMRIEERT